MSGTLTVVLAICIAVFTSITAPIFLARYLEHQRHEDRMEDYARQDKVAAQVEAARVQAEGAASLLLANNEKVEQSNQAIQDKLEVIRTDVNSNLTAHIQTSLKALQGQYATMQALIPQPDIQQVAEMKDISTAIAALQAQLKDRATPELD